MQQEKKILPYAPISLSAQKVLAWMDALLLDSLNILKCLSVSLNTQATLTMYVQISILPSEIQKKKKKVSQITNCRIYVSPIAHLWFLFGVK